MATEADLIAFFPATLTVNTSPIALKWLDADMIPAVTDYPVARLKYVTQQTNRPFDRTTSKSESRVQTIAFVSGQTDYDLDRSDVTSITSITVNGTPVSTANYSLVIHEDRTFSNVVRFLAGAIEVGQSFVVTYAHRSYEDKLWLVRKQSWRVIVETGDVRSGSKGALENFAGKRLAQGLAEAFDEWLVLRRGDVIGSTTSILREAGVFGELPQEPTDRSVHRVALDLWISVLREPVRSTYKALDSHDVTVTNE